MQSSFFLSQCVLQSNYHSPVPSPLGGWGPLLHQGNKWMAEGRKKAVQATEKSQKAQLCCWPHLTLANGQVGCTIQVEQTIGFSLVTKIPFNEHRTASIPSIVTSFLCDKGKLVTEKVRFTCNTNTDVDRGVSCLNQTYWFPFNGGEGKDHNLGEITQTRNNNMTHFKQFYYWKN